MYHRCKLECGASRATAWLPDPQVRPGDRIGDGWRVAQVLEQVAEDDVPEPDEVRSLNPCIAGCSYN